MFQIRVKCRKHPWTFMEVARNTPKYVYRHFAPWENDRSHISRLNKTRGSHFLSVEFADRIALLPVNINENHLPSLLIFPPCISSSSQMHNSSSTHMEHSPHSCSSSDLILQYGLSLSQKIFHPTVEQWFDHGENNWLKILYIKAKTSKLAQAIQMVSQVSTKGSAVR